MKYSIYKYIDIYRLFPSPIPVPKNEPAIVFQYTSLVTLQSCKADQFLLQSIAMASFAEVNTPAAAR